MTDKIKPSTTVFVSGASGFIAQELIKQLIIKGYNVIGSVRSIIKGESIKSNLSSFKNGKFNYIIIKDISLLGAFDNVLQKYPEIEIFIHTASPFHFKAENIEQELLIPAINGTKNALLAIKKYGHNINHVVITSSVVAVGKFGKFEKFEKFPQNNDSKLELIIDENSWNPITWEMALKNPVYGYFGSKTFAEKEVWKFEKFETPKFNITTINPGMVLGPQAFPINIEYDNNNNNNKKKKNLQLNTSSQEIVRLLNLPTNDINKVKISTRLINTFIDVRDVAKAHIIAFENSEKTKNKRLLLIQDFYNDQKLLNIINKNFPQLNLPKGEFIKGEINKSNLKNSWNTIKTKTIFGDKYIEIEKSVIDSVNQILEAKNKESSQCKL
ncbi:oxidoreductase, putative [Candida dubliniensis CD36]|uniref:Oxidoreductase, putative n=1 Tax=Candida dubliniensis (strain CD36 / ATCC MYA-646 / CBS 7987 / NCPF 3949 / NRRL Y-17841) TaxID=573826 RepID=B9WBW0_CANDC|nr:oxidoreductase, putative [Candida dubliniensis CD36]CAX43882.1 oxidoreductase, putative [Candida dubliniensis CD36]